ncbi:MAG: 4-hydroxybenzoate octaprenyltransferase [Gammaproteobacteria bacterium]|nr:4-hydroxybenzoate octaprenyltransferase [Gammaproteobacteria bacterium]MCP5137630.1 4-hydroxybenzoate octaprenyltransferase [Gammaproteobacteria bacterium]
MIERLREYALLMRLNRPIGILLLLWPCLWALWIAAEGLPDVRVLLVFLAGVTLMRSAGCVINDYADRDFDPHVRRTKDRPLAAGRVSSREAIVLFVVLSLLAFALVLLMNAKTIAMSFVAAFLAATYPFMKRYTHLPQIYLGAAFAWAVPMSFMAQTGSVPLIGWVLFVAPILWATAYDTMYAMVDREDDLKIGVKSTAILFGRHERLIIGVIQILMLLDLIWVGALATLSWPYWSGLAVATGLGVYQQWLIRQREPASCFKAFLNNNWLGIAVFMGIAADYAMQSLIRT